MGWQVQRVLVGEVNRVWNISVWGQWVREEVNVLALANVGRTGVLKGGDGAVGC